MKYFPYYVKVDGVWLIDDEVMTLDGDAVPGAYWALFDDVDGATPYTMADLLTIVKRHPNCEIYNDKYRRLSDPQAKELLKEAKEQPPEGLIKWRREHGYDKSTGWQSWH